MMDFGPQRLQKTAGGGTYDRVRGQVSKKINEIRSTLQKEEKRVIAAMTKLGLKVNERASYIDYEMHGSDGLRIGGVFKFEDPHARSKHQLESLLEEIFDYPYISSRGSEWVMHFGDDV
jgi:hypothetical protein